MVQRLIKLGVKPKTAWGSIYKGRRGIWVLSHCAAVDRGLRNAYFAERGLQSLDKLWRQRRDRNVTVAPAQLKLTWG